jgi:hypothetical protein
MQSDTETFFTVKVHVREGCYTSPFRQLLKSFILAVVNFSEGSDGLHVFSNTNIGGVIFHTTCALLQ